MNAGRPPELARAAEEQGSIPSEQELLSTCVMVLFGGHETTTNLIGNGVLALLDNPAELDAPRAAPTLRALLNESA